MCGDQLDLFKSDVGQRNIDVDVTRALKLDETFDLVVDFGGELDEDFDQYYAKVSRSLAPVLMNRASRFPITLVSGPRGSGKSSLCRELFSNHTLLPLSSREVRSRLQENTSEFIALNGPCIHFDDVNCAPELLLHVLKEEINQNPKPGRFIVSGTIGGVLRSQYSTELGSSLSILHLLDIHYGEEWSTLSDEIDLFTTLSRGSSFVTREPFRNHTFEFQQQLDEICSRAKPPNFGSSSFEEFVRLVAGRTALPLNISELSQATVVDRRYIKSWLNLLENEYWIWRVPAQGRQMLYGQWKNDKVYFLNSGLICFLLEIRNPIQFRYHPLRGAIFETWIVSELLKTVLHKGLQPDFSYLQNTSRTKIDLIIEDDNRLLLVDVVSGPVVNRRITGKHLRLKNRMLDRSKVRKTVGHRIFTGGDRRYHVDKVVINGWRSVRFAKNWW